MTFWEPKVKMPQLLYLLFNFLLVQISPREAPRGHGFCLSKLVLWTRSVTLRSKYLSVVLANQNKDFQLAINWV